MFAGSDVAFTHERPQLGVDYSTIFLGGTHAFDEWGFYVGLSEHEAAALRHNPWRRRACYRSQVLLAREARHACQLVFD